MASQVPRLSVVILSWNTRDLTLTCLRSLFGQSPKPQPEREVIVVDNASDDGSAAAIADAFPHPQLTLVLNEENLGYAKANNQGARLARGKYLCTLNSDTEVRPGALDRLLCFLDKHPDHAGVAPKLLNPDGTVQPACMRFPGLWTALCFDTIFGKFPPGSLIERRYRMLDFDHLQSRDVDQPPGACFVIDRQEYLDLGGLDEDLFLFFNDVDFARRLWKRGRRIHYLAEAEVIHHGGASTKGYGDFVVIWHRNRLAYYRKHYGRLVVPYLRAIVRLRALEEWFRAGRRQSDPESLRAERRRLRQSLQEILAR